MTLDETKTLISEQTQTLREVVNKQSKAIKNLIQEKQLLEGRVARLEKFLNHPLLRALCDNMKG